MNTSFQRTVSHDGWYTPPEIVKAVGEFDLDPCTSKEYPYRYGKKIYTKKKDGLRWKWKGRVWCNPPYGSETKKWLKKCAKHNNCMVLIYARTDTVIFHRYVFNKADAIFFFKGRIYFYTVEGERHKYPSGSPSVLVAYGKNNAQILKKASKKLKGVFILLK